jgi:rod shape-determining protein MreC
MRERHTSWLLALLLVGQLGLITFQLPGRARRHTMLEKTAVALVAPLARLVTATSRNLGGLSGVLRRQTTLLAENRRLEAENEALHLEILQLRNADSDAKRLAAALDYARPLDGSLQVADVVFADYSSRLRALLLFTGRHPARQNQPVVAPGGLVGRVILPVGSYAKVQLITDRAAAVGAMIERTRRQGLIRGRTAVELELDLVPLQADVRPGDRVVTSGIDGLYPRGLPIGEVLSVESSGELFHRIRVRPAVDFGFLDQVYLIDSEPLPEEFRQGLSGAPR